MVQGLLSFSLKSQALTQPNTSPGKNSQSLLTEQFFSMRSEPRMIDPKNRPQMPILLPRVSSQQIAKIIPPDPFHPKCILSSIPIRESAQSTLSLLSKLSTGRQGMSSCFRMIHVQLMMKAVRLVTKEYWMMGRLKKRATAMWTTMRTGARMIRVNFEKVITGSPLNSLYSKSRGSTGWLTAGLLRLSMLSPGIKGVLISLLITNLYDQYMDSSQI